jgi:hypothetical protein
MKIIRAVIITGVLAWLLVPAVAQYNTPSVPSSLPLATANQTWYVATTGSDSNPCTSGSPCLTIQHVVNVAAGYNWANNYYPTINVANGTYANTQVNLPALVNVPVTSKPLIIGNTTTPTNVSLNDGGTGYTFNSAIGSRWYVNGLSFGGTYGGVYAHSHSTLFINNLNWGGALVNNGIYLEPNASVYASDDVSPTGTFTISASTMGSWVFNRGILAFDISTITITNAITFSGYFVYEDAQAFFAFNGTTVTNGSNVTATTNGLGMYNGSFFETNSSTKVDGTTLSRANFPGGSGGSHLQVDIWSIFEGDLAGPQAASGGAAAIIDNNGVIRADFNYTSANVWTFDSVINSTSASTTNSGYILTNTSTGGHAIEFGTVGSGGIGGLTVGESYFLDNTTGNIPWSIDTSGNMNFWGTLGWGASSAGSFTVPTKDTGLSRSAAGYVVAGNGTAGNATGKFGAASHIATGASPTGTTGSCSASALAGGSTAGKFTAPLCASGTIILSGLPAAPTGYTCDAKDQTTPADLLNQTANSTTSVTFTGTTALNDVIVFKCMGW